jgi:hypothetical protein
MARVLYALTLFVLLVGVLVTARPRAVFDQDGRPRPFGVTKDEIHTVYSFGALIVTLAVFSFAFFSLIDVVAVAFTRRRQ